MSSSRWSGSDDEFWEAVAVANGEIESEESEAIQAVLLLQEVLHLAQDALTRPEQPVSSNGAPPKLRPHPGDVVDIARATELFADRWILQPVDPDRTSPISAHRDYRWRDGALEFNSSYPPQWKKSGGEISDVPQWRVMCQESMPEVTPQVVGERTSRTTVKTA